MPDLLLRLARTLAFPPKEVIPLAILHFGKIVLLFKISLDGADGVISKLG